MNSPLNRTLNWDDLRAPSFYLSFDFISSFVHYISCDENTVLTKQIKCLQHYQQTSNCSQCTSFLLEEIILRKKQPMKFYSCRPHLPYGSSAIWNILSLEESKLFKWLHSVMSSLHSNYENQALNDWGLRETVSFVFHTLDLFPSTPERVEGQQNSLLSAGPVIKRSVLPTNSRTIAARLYFLS